jgi:hypothetical protein
VIARDGQTYRQTLRPERNVIPGGREEHGVRDAHGSERFIDVREVVIQPESVLGTAVEVEGKVAGTGPIDPCFDPVI